MPNQIDELGRLVNALEKKYPDHNFAWRRQSYFGQHTQGLCPEHDDRSPSLSVSLGKDNGRAFFYCFACGFTGTLKTLSGDVTKDKDNPEIKRQLTQNKRAIELAKSFKDQLFAKKDTAAMTARGYLKERIDTANIGKFIKSKPIGLLKKGFKSSSDFDFEKKLENIAKYSDYIVFVYDDSYGHVTKLHMRKPFSKDFMTVKVTDDNGAFCFHEITQQEKETPESELIFVAEGEFDALALAANGMSAIALGSTSNYKESIVKRIAAHNRIPVLAPDWDEAGQKTAENLLQTKIDKKKTYIVCKQTGYEAKDFDELLKDKREDEINLIIRNLKIVTLKEYARQLDEKRQEELRKKYEVLPCNLKRIVYKENSITNTDDKISLSNLLNEDLPEIDWIWHGFETETVGLFLGTGGIGKSFLAMQFAACVADETKYADMFGIFTGKKRGKVGYVSLEDPIINLKYRTKAILQYYKKYDDGHENKLQLHRLDQMLESIYDNLTITSIVGKGFNLAKKTIKGIQPNHRWIDWLLRFAEGKRLVILDTLSRIHELDGNGNSDMAALLNIIETVSANTGTSILLLHHISKSALLNGVSDSTAARGATALVDNSRFVMQIQSLTDEDAQRLMLEEEEIKFHAKVLFTKLNYAPPLDPFYAKKITGGVLEEVRI